METLKKFFPYSFKAKRGLGDLIVMALVYLVVGLIAGAVIGIVSQIPIIGWIIGIVGGLVDLVLEQDLFFLPQVDAPGIELERSVDGLQLPIDLFCFFFDLPYG